MNESLRPRVKYVIGPDGSPLTIADLPPPSTKRWVIRRKAEVVAAVRGGLLSLEEACARYTLTVDEFLSWQVSIDQFGLAGLRTTRIQQYRHWRHFTQYPWSFDERHGEFRAGLRPALMVETGDVTSAAPTTVRAALTPFRGRDALLLP
jgi:hypothetical protein